MHETGASGRALIRPGLGSTVVIASVALFSRIKARTSITRLGLRRAKSMMLLRAALRLLRAFALLVAESALIVLRRASIAAACETLLRHRRTRSAEIGLAMLLRTLLLTRSIRMKALLRRGLMAARAGAVAAIGLRPAISIAITAGGHWLAMMRLTVALALSVTLLVLAFGLPAFVLRTIAAFAMRLRSVRARAVTRALPVALLRLAFGLPAFVLRTIAAFALRLRIVRARAVTRALPVALRRLSLGPAAFALRTIAALALRLRIVRARAVTRALSVALRRLALRPAAFVLRTIAAFAIAGTFGAALAIALRFRAAAFGIRTIALWLRRALAGGRRFGFAVFLRGERAGAEHRGDGEEEMERGFFHWCWCLVITAWRRASRRCPRVELQTR
ncbi:MAG: hypothetical protein ABMA13_23280 [Chthoniobacteraceae bacterium]